MLFEAQTNEQCKLSELDLRKCSLTDQCINSLGKVKASQDGRCRLPLLLLYGNKFTENGRRLLRDVTRDHVEV